MPLAYSRQYEQRLHVEDIERIVVADVLVAAVAVEAVACPFRD